MKKKLLFVVCLLVFTLCLTGCSFNVSIGESEEEKMCDNLQELVDQYEQKSLSYNEVVTKAEDITNSYCSENEDESICLHIKAMRNQADYDYTLEDCNAKPTSPVDTRSLCESTNKLKQSMLDKREETNDAYVSNLEYSCELLNEK